MNDYSASLRSKRIICSALLIDCPVAANWAALGICYNSGQDCTAGSRVYVQDGIYDKFLELLIAKAKALKFGDAFDDTVASGPLVTTCHYFLLVFLSGI